MLLFDETDMRSIRIIPLLGAEKSSDTYLDDDAATCYFDSISQTEIVDLSEYDNISENDENPDWNLLRDIENEIALNDELGYGAPILTL